MCLISLIKINSAIPMQLYNTWSRSLPISSNTYNHWNTISSATNSLQSCY